MEWVKVIHIISLIAWMCGLLYLPRLFIYHIDASNDTASTFEIMEYRLHKYIMNPAMMLTWVTGLWMALSYNYFAGGGWLHAKLTLVVLLTIAHVMMGRYRKAFCK